MSNEPDNSKHILVINDDPAILNLFEELLGEAGYRVTLDNFQRTTTELLQAVRELQPDLVIMDFVVGGELKGWQLLQATQMDRSVRDIPVIVCTAAAKQVTELTSHLDSMNIYVVLKPFDIDKLLKVVDTVWQSQPSPASDPDTMVSKVDFQ